jgi:hypothetical protein
MKKRKVMEMAWKIKAVLDGVSMVAIAVGTAITQYNREAGAIIVACGLAIKAAAEYLYEQGIIVGLKRR